MRITPLDVRKQEFRRVVRGLEPDEVYAFLATVADEYEAVLGDNKQLREKLLELDEKVSEYRNMERTLRDTLLTAERVMTEARENARKEGQLILEDARLKSERETASISSKVEAFQNQIRELRGQRDGFLIRMKTLAESQIAMVDNYQVDFGDEEDVDRTGPVKTFASAPPITDEFEPIAQVVDVPIETPVPMSQMGASASGPVAPVSGPVAPIHEGSSAPTSGPVTPLPGTGRPIADIGDRWRDYSLKEEAAQAPPQTHVPPSMPEAPVVTGADRASPGAPIDVPAQGMEDLADVVAEVSAEVEARASGSVPVYRDQTSPSGQSGPTMAPYPGSMPDAAADDSYAELASSESDTAPASAGHEPEEETASTASGWSLSRFTRGLGQL